MGMKNKFFMKKDNLQDMFSRLEQGFDIESPNSGHKDRFLEKLNAQNQKQIVSRSKSNRNLWAPLLGIAASILLIVTLTFSFSNNEEPSGLASVSPKMAETQSFFAAVIEEELSKIEKERAPETEWLINDAMTQMKTLEKQYNTFKIDLKESGNDKRVIHAMIDNFYNRIELLKTVLKSIEDVKLIKQNFDENSNTI